MERHLCCLHCEHNDEDPFPDKGHKQPCEVCDD